MVLRSLAYSEYDGTPNEWILDSFDIGSINLLVGKNATGKTRTLNIVGNLANILAGHRKTMFDYGRYRLVFDNDGQSVVYELFYKDATVELEKLTIDDQVKLDRGHGGEGDIYAAQLGDMMKFQSPPGELVAFARRDNIQHPFFECLHNWGGSVRHYYFGSPMGKETLLMTVGDGFNAPNPKETDKVTGIALAGIQQFQKKFTDAVIDDLAQIGYEIDEFGVDTVPGIVVMGAPSSHASGIYAKEKELGARTYQTPMSQGMFRALSLIVQINYSNLCARPDCILIDDIGEGLDYERSTRLIALLIEKATKLETQLIMSTNDRFVMNNVPLEYWAVLQRYGDRCRVFNYRNSKTIFEEFEFTGLSNFDFLSTEYYLKGDTGE